LTKFFSKINYDKLEKQMRFYLEAYKEQLNQAREAYFQRDEKRAKYHFLKAAEYLMRLAKESTGKMKQIRFNNAKKLLKISQELKIKPIKQKVKEVEEEEKPPADEWIVKEKPETSFDDIAGLEDVKEQIKIKMIYPFLYPELAQRYRVKTGGGVLLFGPPGTGKTMLSKAIARELDATFFFISPSDILNKWVGESEKNVRRLFEMARSCQRAVIFIDEVEALLPKRHTTQSTIMQRVVPQLLSEIDGFYKEKRRNILLIGATNEPWAIDHAMLRPGRFDEKIYIGLPDFQARRKILELNLRDMPLSDDVNLDEIAQKLEDYSGADIAYLCKKVSERVFVEAIKQDVSRNIMMKDFDEIIENLPKSVSQKELEKFEKFRKTL
jgi:transitional endoplasmic reticulum ATPase